MAWDYNPFAERELPPMSEAMFATLVVARLRAVPGVEILLQSRLELKLRVRGENTTARLDESYRQYRAEPGALHPIVDEAIQRAARLTSTAQSNPTGAFAQIAPHLFPILIGAADWEQKRRAGINLVTRPLAGDVSIALVMDGDKSVTFLDYATILQWKVETATAYETALDNLERAAQVFSFSVIGEGVNTLLIDRAADGYAATRAILPARLDDWARRVEGELVLGLPQRDFLIGLSSEHPSFAALRAQVAQDWQEATHALSRELLVYRDGALEIWE